MKTVRVFWGVLFLAVGVLLLLTKFDLVSFEWGSLWRFWPVVLILWGVWLVVEGKKSKWIFVVLGAVTLAMVVLAVLDLVGGVYDGEEPFLAESREFTRPYDSSIGRASLAFESGAGMFTLLDTTTELVTATTRTGLGSYELVSERTDGTEHIRMKLTGPRHRRWRGGVDNRASIALHTNPIWEMTFDVGAARLDLDLRPYTIERLTVNSGATSLRLELGDRADETHVKIDAGASSVKVGVPAGVGCDIKIDAPLSGKRFEGFEKISSSHYRTEGFDSATKKIWLDIDAGVSSINIARD